MTEQLHQISIPGLPDGWRAVAYRVPVEGEFIFTGSRVQIAMGNWDYDDIRLIVEKIKPREFTLIETDEPNSNRDKQTFYIHGANLEMRSEKYWRIKEVE